MNKYQERVEDVLVRTTAEIQQIADEYRSDVLVPFCRAHDLTYMAGNGRTAFYDRSDASVDEIDRPELTEVLSVLNIPVIGNNDVLGYYVTDVRAEDIGRRPRRRRLR